jgi:hypothetical protein
MKAKDMAETEDSNHRLRGTLVLQGKLPLITFTTASFQNSRVKCNEAPRNAKAKRGEKQ